jgi:regulatory protein
MAFGQTSLKGRALKLLAAREHSRRELERKLAPHEAEPGQLKAALDELQARGFIDEQRVVESVLHRRAARLGAGRIRQELQAKGLDAQRVAEAVSRLQSSEFERAREVWRRRFGAPPADARERAKQGRFLLARGFSAEAVRRVLAWDPDEDGGA